LSFLLLLKKLNFSVNFGPLSLNSSHYIYRGKKELSFKGIFKKKLGKKEIGVILD